MAISKKVHDAELSERGHTIHNLEMLLTQVINGDALMRDAGDWRLIVRTSRYSPTGDSFTACAVYQMIEGKWQLWGAGSGLGDVLKKISPLVDFHTEHGRSYLTLRELLVNAGAHS